MSFEVCSLCQSKRPSRALCNCCQTYLCLDHLKKNMNNFFTINSNIWTSSLFFVKIEKNWIDGVENRSRGSIAKSSKKSTSCIRNVSKMCREKRKKCKVNSDQSFETKTERTNTSDVLLSGSTKSNDKENLWKKKRWHWSFVLYNSIRHWFEWIWKNPIELDRRWVERFLFSPRILIRSSRIHPEFSFLIIRNCFSTITT